MWGMDGRGRWAGGSIMLSMEGALRKMPLISSLCADGCGPDSSPQLRSFLPAATATALPRLSLPSRGPHRCQCREEEMVRLGGGVRGVG